MPRVIQFEVFIIFNSFNGKIFFHSNSNNFVLDVDILIRTSIMLLAKFGIKFCLIFVNAIRNVLYNIDIFKDLLK